MAKIQLRTIIFMVLVLLNTRTHSKEVEGRVQRLGHGRSYDSGKTISTGEGRSRTSVTRMHRHLLQSSNIEVEGESGNLAPEPEEDRKNETRLLVDELIANGLYDGDTLPETCIGDIKVDYGASVFFNISQIDNKNKSLNIDPESLLFTGSVNIHNFDPDMAIESWTLSWIFDGSERVINVGGATLGGNVPSQSLPGTQVTFTDLDDIRTRVFPGGSIVFNFIGESLPGDPHVRLPFKMRFNGQDCHPIAPPDTMFRSDIESLLDMRLQGHDSFVEQEILKPPVELSEDPADEMLTNEKYVRVKLLPIDLQVNSPYTPSEYYSPFLVDIEIEKHIPLDSLVFQYWFAGVHGRPDPWLYRFVCYRAENLIRGCDDIIGVIAHGVDGVPGAELVLQVSFAKGTEYEFSEADAFFLDSLTIGSVTIGIEVENYALVLDSDSDWSNNNLKTSASFQINERMPAFINRSLVWGISPYSITEVPITDVTTTERHVEAKCENLLDDGWSCNLFAQFCCGQIEAEPASEGGNLPIEGGNSSLVPQAEVEDVIPSEDTGGENTAIWIAGGVIAGTIAAALITVVILLSIRRWRKKNEKYIVDIDSPPNNSSPTSGRKKSFPESSNGFVYYTTTDENGNEKGFNSAPASEITSITMPRSQSYDEYTQREPQWNFGDKRDSSNLVGSRFYIEAPVDRDSPVNGSFEIDFNNEILLESIIGNGAFGSVYRGHWRGMNVAVKLMASQGTSLLDSFHAEVEVLSRLKHPNIVQFLGASVVPPHLCLVEELVENGSLWNLLHSELPDMPPPPRPQSLMRTLDLAEEIASALSYIHPTIVHRDLKSGNVLLDGEWHAKVADFGIARFKNNTYMTTHGGGAGTAAYMAPELFSAGRIDEKSDIFSLGVLVWEIYLGEIPWSDCTHPMQVVMAIGINNERLRLPDDMPKVLSHIIKKCWREDPHRRPSASEFVRYIQKERRALLSSSNKHEEYTTKRNSSRSVENMCTSREEIHDVDHDASNSDRTKEAMTPREPKTHQSVLESNAALSEQRIYSPSQEWATAHSVLSDTSDDSTNTASSSCPILAEK